MQPGWQGPLPQSRIERLLATRRPGIKSPDWLPRIRALNFAKAHAIPALREMLDDETRAMWEERDDARRREQERRWGPRQQDQRDADQAASLHCEMREASVRGLTVAETAKARICFLDARTLPARRRIWCSEACVTRWHQNHAWGWARHGAIERDGGRCQRCGRERQVIADQCGNCGKPWVDGDWALPCERGGWVTDHRRGVRGHSRYTTWLELEVNHMDPRVGRGYHDGCHNHLDRLETLCHQCHVVETTRQGRERKASGPGGSRNDHPFA